MTEVEAHAAGRLDVVLGEHVGSRAKAARLIDAGVLHGLDPDAAAQMVIETMAGSASVLRATDADTRGLRRRVTSPGGTTARGLAALEQAGVRAAFEDAVTSVVDFTKR